MSKYVVINPAHGGSDTGNINGGVKESDYTLKIANEVSRLLSNDGIANKIIRTKDQTISDNVRINQIVSTTPNSKDTIVLTIGIDSDTPDIEIIYALRNTDKLSSMLANNFEDKGFSVSKYYARRLPSDTSKDYHDIIRETEKRESLMIEYGDLSDPNFIENNWQEFASITAKTIETYLGTVGTFYTVKSGDSLYSIAKKYGVSVDDLKRVNNLGTNMLSIGQKLLIPEVTEPEEPLIPSSENVYVVKSGDTLYSIAGANNITVDSLKSANNLTSNTLQVGQKLIIPSVSGSKTYVVKSGDNLYTIAASYGTTVNEIKRVNNLTSNLLNIGQKLIIPSTTSPSNPTTYIVKSGDTLYGIASKYDVSVDEIKSSNNLTSNTLQVGQVLTIPTVPSSSSRTYIVQKGDNLYTIAQKYNVSVASIMNANNLTSNVLSIGQKLNIPS